MQPVQRLKRTVNIYMRKKYIFYSNIFSGKIFNQINLNNLNNIQMYQEILLIIVIN